MRGKPGNDQERGQHAAAAECERSLHSARGAAFAVLSLALGAVARGPNACEQVAIDINDRTLECRGTPASEGDTCDTDEGCYVCTEDRARVARCHSECVRAADCGAFTDSLEEAFALASCMEACHALADN